MGLEEGEARKESEAGHWRGFIVGQNHVAALSKGRYRGEWLTLWCTWGAVWLQGTRPDGESGPSVVATLEGMKLITALCNRRRDDESLIMQCYVDAATRGEGLELAVI